MPHCGCCTATMPLVAGNNLFLNGARRKFEILSHPDTDIGVTLEEIIDPPGQNKQNL